MKRSGMTVVFVLVCAIVLVGAYGLGVCVREYRFRSAAVGQPVTAEVQKPAAEPAAQGLAGGLATAPAAPPGAPDGMPSPGERPGFGGDRMAGMRDRFENMSEEERQQAQAQMREKYGFAPRGFGGGGFGGSEGGRRRPGGAPDGEQQ